jgi:hypothetical protein
MHPDLSPLLPVTDIDFGGSIGANMLPLEKGTNAEHRTGPPLTLATMAGYDGIGIGGNFDTQGTKEQCAVLVIVPLPYPGAASLQECGCQSDP